MTADSSKAPPGTTIRQALAASRSIESVSGTPLLDCQLLLADVLTVSRAFLYANDDQRLTAAEFDAYRNRLARRASGEPVAYILGRRDFWNFSLMVNRATLVPRPDTELLVETVLASLGTDPLRLVDLGTGTGAIAIALARQRPCWQVIATDNCRATLDVTLTNIAAIAAGRVDLVMADWLAPFAAASFDAIVANPPYIPDGDPHLDALGYEPLAALVSGVDGLDAIRNIVAAARTTLKPGGQLFLEHGFDQSEAVATILAEAGFISVRCEHDIAGHPRVTTARRRQDHE